MDQDLQIPDGLALLLKGLDMVGHAGRLVDLPAQPLLSRMLRIDELSAAINSSLPACRLASPAQPIQTGFDSNGNLRLECLHAPMHCWDLSGRKGGC